MQPMGFVLGIKLDFERKTWSWPKDKEGEKRERKWQCHVKDRGENNSVLPELWDWG